MGKSDGAKGDMDKSGAGKGAKGDNSFNQGAGKTSGEIGAGKKGSFGEGDMGKSDGAKGDFDKSGKDKGMKGDNALKEAGKNAPSGEISGLPKGNVGGQKGPGGGTSGSSAGGGQSGGPGGSGGGDGGKGQDSGQNSGKGDLNKDGGDKGDSIAKEINSGNTDTGGKEIKEKGSSNPNPEDSGDSSGPKKPGPGSGPKGGGAEPQGDGKKKPGGSGGGIEGDWRQEGPAGLNKGGSGSGSGKPGSNHGDGGDWSGEGPQGFKPRHGEGSAKRVGGTDPMEPVTCPSCSAAPSSQLENKSLGANTAKNLELRSMETNTSFVGQKASASAMPSINDFGGLGRAVAGHPAAAPSSVPSMSGTQPASFEKTGAATVRHTPSAIPNGSLAIPNGGNLSRTAPGALR